ncbi:MAG: glycoside hydrolase, partial [Planctomycetes bacterium]|nr:glycoside hydrolase [Planctomycetota bacterium]
MSDGTIYPHVEQEIFKDNPFPGREMRAVTLPDFDKFYNQLPQPYWAGHDDALACYRKTWEIAYRNILSPKAGTGFVSPFIDTAFNGDLFMWDSSFILMFARYGKSAFDFQGTLDNFYAKQHNDGFISRQLNEETGAERFERHDPSSTGPNVMPWCEWEYYLNFGDKERLTNIFPALFAYHRWMRSYRSWPDGSYWSSGWGCGMDNQPRCPEDCNHSFHHGFMSWVDATAQALISAQYLLKMGKEIAAAYDLSDLDKEVKALTGYLNEKMWNEELGIYTDRFRDGSLSNVITVAGFWPILAGVVDEYRLGRMMDLLD